MQHFIYYYPRFSIEPSTIGQSASFCSIDILCVPIVILMKLIIFDEFGIIFVGIKRQRGNGFCGFPNRDKILRIKRDFCIVLDSPANLSVDHKNKQTTIDSVLPIFQWLTLELRSFMLLVEFYIIF